MSLQVADTWFERRMIDDGITLLWEPYVVPLDRCNIWHIRGRDRDLLIDSGLGVCSLRTAASELFEHQTISLATHSHYDHTGCFHEFELRAAHQAEKNEFTNEALASLRVDTIPEDILVYLDRVGYGLTTEYLITALPEENFPIDTWRQTAASPTWLIDEGDVIDLGNRQFEVLHLPGHSPGSVGLWEADTGILFSGDAIYDGPLLDEFPESNIAVYVETMERLMSLPVNLVHAGHDPSFDRIKLRQIARQYIDSRS
jgi:glyoxylase-like metal-dependent hydrolase (beta-lactamase superfamily II)